ncbi:MAG: SDR family oxidoreductase [Planctomycetes bacterium]|nr:SDR family oxidoreductase [Planctomycetota bacterium]
MILNGRTAVITGGASGIGQAVCMKLANEEEVRAIAVVDQAGETEQFCRKLNDALGRPVLLPYCGDVTDRAFRESVFQDMEERFGPVTLCVPAAGIVRDRLAVKLDQTNGKVKHNMYDEDEFRRVIDVDLLAPIYWAMRMVASVAMDRATRGLKQWVPAETMQGAIVLIGSISSAGNRGQIAYATAKRGLEGAQATLAKEAVYFGVRCAIIHPGFTDTPMVRSLGEEMIKDRILPNTQLRRLIRPDEIAGAIVFMLKNSAVSGTLWADAGWHPTA